MLWPYTHLDSLAWIHSLGHNIMNALPGCTQLWRPNHGPPSRTLGIDYGWLCNNLRGNPSLFVTALPSPFLLVHSLVRHTYIHAYTSKFLACMDHESYMLPAYRRPSVPTHLQTHVRIRTYVRTCKQAYIHICVWVRKYVSTHVSV